MLLLALGPLGAYDARPRPLGPMRRFVLHLTVRGKGALFLQQKMVLANPLFYQRERERYAGQGEPFLLLLLLRVSFRFWRLRGCVVKVPKMRA